MGCFADDVEMNYTELLALGGHYAAPVNRDTDLAETAA